MDHSTTTSESLTVAETEVEEIPICIALLSAHSVDSAPTTPPTREGTSSSHDFGDDSTPLTRAVVAGLLNPAGAAFARRSHLWDNGEKISYCFLNGTPQQQRKVEDVMEEWTWYGNFTFVRLGNGDMSAFVRIEFKQRLGAWSYIGKDALNLKTGPTMQQDISDNDKITPHERYMILHEFGHALGLIHEHQGPGAAEAFGKLNEQQVLKWYKKLGKSDEAIQQDVLYFYNKTEVSNYSAFDRRSIMGYVVNPEFNSNGITANLNYELSNMDKAYMVINYNRPSAHPKAPQWTVGYALKVAGVPKRISRNWQPSNIREEFSRYREVSQGKGNDREVKYRKPWAFGMGFNLSQPTGATKLRRRAQRFLCLGG